jgi:hypothetical protein
MSIIMIATPGFQHSRLANCDFCHRYGEIGGLRKAQTPNFAFFSPTPKGRCRGNPPDMGVMGTGAEDVKALIATHPGIRESPISPV